MTILTSTALARRGEKQAVTAPKDFLIKLNKNLNILREREAKYGGSAPLDLFSQIDDHHTAIALTEQLLAGELNRAEWREALRPLLVEIASRTGEAASSVTLGDIGGGIHDSTIAGGDVVGRDKFIVGTVETLIINYPPPPPPTVPEVETPAEPIPDNPYRGLFAFRPEHAHLFFGRETFTEKLVQATDSRSLVAVLGASGTGKSSVVFAGLVPALLNRSDGRWLFTTFRPGDDPFLGLANALVPLLDPELSKTRQTGEARDLATRLREGHSPLADYLTTIHHAYPDSRLLLIADQFEEGRGVAKNEAEAFRWHELAAGTGNGEAILELAFCYEKGRGIAVDERRFVELVRQAADEGEVKAQTLLAIELFQGRRIIKNVDEGLQW
ncbi:MAG: sel1 repeat family protein, partial [Chloroflexi bacterium]|nr:sel1 repeat family protein [Chloroflexota bacterium]